MRRGQRQQPAQLPGNGICDDGLAGDGYCIACDAGNYGQTCADCLCQNGVCNQGVLGDGHCTQCNLNYYGNDCATACTCVNGNCDYGVSGSGSCSCFASWSGLNCDIPD